MSRFRHLRSAASLAVASCAVTLAVASPSVARATNTDIQVDAYPTASYAAIFPDDVAARDDRPPKNSRAGSGSRSSR